MTQKSPSAFALRGGSGSPKWLRPAGLAGLLFIINVFICRRLFVTEYTQDMGSIEAAYIGISRYLLGHFGDWRWFPLWYCGIPFQNTYPPLLHAVVAAFAWLFRWSPALAHHAVTATFYSLGPAALFLMARELSGDDKTGFLAGLFYSLISPSAFLMPSIYGDLHSYWAPRRLHALVKYGDGPHVTSLTLLPIAVLLLHLCVKKGGPVRTLAATLAMASVALTNWLGTFSLAIAVVSYLLANLGTPEWPRMVRRSAVAGILAYGLAAPWIPPSTIRAIQRNAQYVIGHYPLGLTQVAYAAVLFMAAAALHVLLRRLRAPMATAFAAYFCLFMSAITLTSEWFHIYLMPQPDRYHLEMEMGLCLAAALGIGALVRRLSPGRSARDASSSSSNPTSAAAAWSSPVAGRARLMTRRGLAAVAIVLCAVQVRNYRREARRMIQPIQIESTVEFQAARWLEDHMPHDRIFATGSVQFWLNAFADTPMMGGGFGQGIINETIPVVHFGIPYTQRDGEMTAMWLRVYGAKAVVVSGRNGRDVYRQDWHDPEKFKGVLPVLWQDGDDVIYGVPVRSPSLAHVLLRDQVVRRAPINNVDFEPVTAFDAALRDESLPKAGFVFERPDSALIQAEMKPEQVISVQVSYAPGWHASVNGQRRPIERDGLGFMIVQPGCNGPCQIRLNYDGGTEMTLAQIARAGSALIFVVWLGFRRNKNAPPAA